MNVAKITSEKAEELQGQEYQQGVFFSPIQDKNGDFIISLVEAQFIPIADFEVVEYEPIESEMPL